MLQELEREAVRLSKTPEDAFSVLASFRDILKEERLSRNRPRGLVNIEPHRYRETVVIGDIHGDLDTLIQILSRVDIERILKSNGLLVFLGDYVDRGDKQLETLLLVALLKKRYGENVITLRGNHEPPSFLPVYPHDYPEILREMYGEDGEKIYRVSREIFDLLPYAAVCEGVAAFLHGGIPVFSTEVCGYDVKCILDADSSEKVLEEILWNDPIEDPDVDYMPSPRGAGFLWGEVVTSMFIRKTGVKIVVRGHEPVWDGYKLNHGMRVLTVFSRKGAPYYNAYAAAYILDLRSFSGFSRENLILV